MQKKVQQLQCNLPVLAGLACAFFIFPLSAIAQTDTTKKLKEVKIQTSLLPQIQNPVPSQQISANDFYRYSAFNVADAIRDFAGVNIKDYGGIGGLKTVSVRSLGADHLAVLYDGLQINDAENGQIDLGKINLINIQEIVLYNAQPPQICQPARSFASASVLSIKTTRPGLTVAKPYLISLGVKGGSFGLINPYVQWQQRVNSGWSFVINSYLERANGQYKYTNDNDGSTTPFTRTNAGISTQQTDGALYWTKNDSNRFNVHVNYYNSDRGIPGAAIYYAPPSRQQLWNKDAFVQSTYDRLWQSSLHLLLNAKLSQENTRYVNPDYLNGHGGLDEHYTQREVYQSTALSYHLLPSWELSYATDISLSSLDIDIYNYSYPTRFTLLNVLATNFTTGKWRFEGNLLGTYINDQLKTGSAPPQHKVLSPTLMATFQPFSNSNLLVRGFYKDIFRDPTFDELYYFPVNGPRDLKPEVVKQFDAGVTYRKSLGTFLDYFTLTIDGYYNSVTNKIVYSPTPGIPSVINLGKVDIKGVDVAVKTQTITSSGWRGLLSVNYTYQSALNVTSPADSYYNQQIPYTPKNALALNEGVDYKNIGLYYNQVISSSRYYASNNTPENMLDGYTVSDISFVCKFAVSKLPAVFSVNINNVFNQNYVIVRSYPMPGRSFLLSFQITI